MVTCCYLRKVLDEKVKTLRERKYIMVNGVQQAQGYDVDESA